MVMDKSSGLLLAIIGMMIPGTPFAQDLTVVNISGECELTIAGDQQTCESVAYTFVESTGRAAFHVPTELGAIAFSGKSDVQPRLTRYILTVDSILAGRGDGSSQRSPASGRCEMEGSADGRLVRSLHCEAATEFGRMILELTGDGKPVGVLHQ